MCCKHFAELNKTVMKFITAISGHLEWHKQIRLAINRTCEIDIYALVGHNHGQSGAVGGSFFTAWQDV